MKRLLIFSAFCLSLYLPFSLNTTQVTAHPGNTAADGCHYCRTRCDYWGVAWNERHCHGGSEERYTPPGTYEPDPEPTPTPDIESDNSSSDYSTSTSDSSKSPNADKSDTNSCMAATAVSGTADEKFLSVIRNFRDETLYKSQFGTKLASLYYRTSSAVVPSIENNKIAKSSLRILLVKPAGKLLSKNYG